MTSTHSRSFSPAFTSINKGPGWLKPGPSASSQLRGQAFSQKTRQHPEIAIDEIKNIMPTTHDLHGLIKLSQARSAQQIDRSKKWLGPDLSKCGENQQNGTSNNCQQKLHAVSLEQIRRI